MFLIKFFQHSSNFRRKFQAILEYTFRESDKITPSPPPPLSKDERLRDIGHAINIGNLTLNVNSVTVSNLINYDSLFTKCDSYFITKCVYYYYKMRQFKMR